MSNALPAFVNQAQAYRARILPGQATHRIHTVTAAGEVAKQGCCVPLTSRSGLRKTLITSLKPSTTMAANAHRGGILLLAALLASCVALAYRKHTMSVR